MMKQHLAILCDNKPGVLTHVAGLISRRAINIEYINAGYTEEPDVTRINIVVSVEDQRALNQAILQLARLIDVIKVVNLDEIIGYRQPGGFVPRQDRGRQPGIRGHAGHRQGRPYRSPAADAEGI